MASTRKPKPDLRACVAAAVRAHVGPGSHLTVGLSGGIDSVVLLDALAACAHASGITLDALHVHHGLQPDADRWADFCVALGARHGVATRVERVLVDRASGLGIEAAARAARYAALAGAGADVVALAHHRGDQAETLLLQLVRGAGVAGLAGMPAWQPGAPALLRPLLKMDRAAIESEARARNLAWIDDPSNADVRYARNAVRHRVLPLLHELNAAAAANLARSAGHLADAQSILADVGRADLAACAGETGVRIDALLALGAPRARNAVRVQLEEAGCSPPSARRLDALLRQLAEARADGTVHVALDGVAARRYRNELLLVREDAGPAAPGFSAVWQGGATWPLPALGGTLHIQAAIGEGLAARYVMPGALEVRVRRGGERLQVAPGRPHRSLKNLFQESGLPPWERMRLPLVYCEGALVCVPGIGTDPAYSAAPGMPGARLHWEPSRTAKGVIK
jgi:tRNA(Ile)-lysidine synthase